MKVKKWTACAIELVFPYVFPLLFISISTYLLNGKFSGFKWLDSFLKGDTKLSLLMTIPVVLIGFYVTVLSVVGANNSYSVAKLSEEKHLVKKFIRYSSESLFTAFLFLICSILISSPLIKQFSTIYFTFFIWMLSNTMRFTMIVITLFQINMENAASQVREDKKEKDKILGLLQSIDTKLKNDAYLESKNFTELKEELEQQRKNTPDLPDTL